MARRSRSRAPRPPSSALVSARSSTGAEKAEISFLPKVSRTFRLVVAGGVIDSVLVLVGRLGIDLLGQLERHVEGASSRNVDGELTHAWAGEPLPDGEAVRAGGHAADLE